MIRKLIKKIRKSLSNYQRLEIIENEMIKINSLNRNSELIDDKDIKINIAKLLIAENNKKELNLGLENYEFQVFSQWGDDGIIQYLIQNVDIKNKTFIEFGVENYKESNTRFLLINNNWSGFIIDGCEKNIDYIKKDSIYWKYDLHAVSTFITKENINSILNDVPFDEKVGILSIDIDGNDYWVWKEINKIDPTIVIIEYNSLFGDTNPWTQPYEANYVRSREFPDMNFWGASYKSLCDLAEIKGYALVGCNSNGNNIYFVKKDSLGKILPIEYMKGFVMSKFRETDFLNSKNRISKKEALKLLSGRLIYNTNLNELENIK